MTVSPQNSLSFDTLLSQLQTASIVAEEHCLAIADSSFYSDKHTSELMTIARQLRDQGFRNTITYSPKVFVPLTHLCRDVCHYCTFAKTPKRIQSPYMSIDEVLAVAQAGAQLHCKEALFTLGEKPEMRYSAARKALEDLGFPSTIHYVAHAAKRVLDETGLLPHINAGCLTAEEIALLRSVSASMGLMLESASLRLCGKDMPHYGSPDKHPEARLKTIALAGEANVPFTSGILIGIGETRRERVEALLALRQLHHRYGHIQEIIIQNFKAKPDTKMAQSPEPDLNELLWTIAVARILFGKDMSIQAPPNLSPGVLSKIIAAGSNDWGGVSPVTPDHVNPEAPWPELKLLANETQVAGKYLQQRLTIYPSFAINRKKWLDKSLQPTVLQLIDSEGFARSDNWSPGKDIDLPKTDLDAISQTHRLNVSFELIDIVKKCRQSKPLGNTNVVRLFQARGDDFTYLCQQADQFRQELIGDTVSYVVTRNINYTNICYFKCQFCAFSKGKLSENLRGRPYDLGHDEIAKRVRQAWHKGATEVCLQGGIHPDYTGQTYLDILAAVKKEIPNIHAHAFSPLEIFQGAATLNITVENFLSQLKTAGLNSLPGTAAEILDDNVRAELCPDKINTEQWLSVMSTAHKLGFKTTATIMFGHLEKIEHWATHLLLIRQLQQQTGGFTEFVPLPFVHMESPLFLRGKARKGPTFRESVLMHAVSRLVLSPFIQNIQTSWVKMGKEGTVACLNAGVNDLGGTLMDESITRAAGTVHGQECTQKDMETIITSTARNPRQRTTLYSEVNANQKSDQQTERILFSQNSG